MKRFTIDTRNEDAVSHLIEYIIISGILVIIIAITLPMVSIIFIERPSDHLSYYAYTDIANGVSTRIVGVYAMTTDFSEVAIESKFDIPDSVAGRDYYVEISGDGTSQNVTVFRNSVKSTVSIAGIGATRRAGGQTAGHGVNKITYNFP